METLEGNLLVMRRAGKISAAKAAAAAIKALGEQVFHPQAYSCNQHR